MLTTTLYNNYISVDGKKRWKILANKLVYIVSSTLKKVIKNQYRLQHVYNKNACKWRIYVEYR